MCSLGCGTSLNQKNQVQGSLTLSVRQSVAHVLVPFHQFPALNKHVVKSWWQGDEPQDSIRHGDHGARRWDGLWSNLRSHFDQGHQWNRSWQSSVRRSLWTFARQMCRNSSAGLGPWPAAVPWAYTDLLLLSLHGSLGIWFLSTLQGWAAGGSSRKYAALLPGSGQVGPVGWEQISVTGGNPIFLRSTSGLRVSGVFLPCSHRSTGLECCGKFSDRVWERSQVGKHRTEQKLFWAFLRFDQHQGRRGLFDRSQFGGRIWKVSITSSKGRSLEEASIESLWSGAEIAWYRWRCRDGELASRTQDLLSSRETILAVAWCIAVCLLSGQEQDGFGSLEICSFLRSQKTTNDAVDCGILAWPCWCGWRAAWAKGESKWGGANHGSVVCSGRWTYGGGSGLYINI